MRIVVDPGHGGKDPGAVRRWTPYKGLTEAEVVLDIGLDVRDRLVSLRHEVRMTRETDEFISLSDRAAMGDGANLFVSIHANAATSQSAQGTEVLYYSGSKQGRSCAEMILRHLVHYMGLRSRGTKPRKNLAVLRRTKCPAVLVETCFISNPEEGMKLAIPEIRHSFAVAIVAGIEAYR
ncbi:N-acetylmuramoyl-L-alanine amidase [Dethiosulfovibrio sp. F2B]|uniref:N-acetylmuramoyl-L-alanine amidase family protein n=1 Tax=Dethiosulfovibrio faecalis TaxID=2720018 RepID=UPI001F16E987|nr:N-acetylmuramoyl-L-alanine amidase [Dethiosulfovibrio faecalis]MCF4150569.1 N-acetylmuramoyl-L-alanine amidase [Dethiosulfovibrio faecalis]